MKEVNSITAFLFSENNVLILRRSRHVRSYQNTWGGVSGIIDKGRTDIEQALLEIEEETGLASSDIQLIKQGEPQRIIDVSRNLIKVIHPFLFQVKDRNNIQINWEHSEFKWIKPGDIEDYQTMPKLKETLERVLTLI